MIEPLKLENAKIFYKNFTGIQPALNKMFRREFSVKIDGRKAEKIRKKGWNVKCGKIKNKKVWFIPVTIKEFYYPSIISIALKDTGNIIELSYIDLKILDYVDIDNAYVEIDGYEWNYNDKHGVKAYLKFAMFTVDSTVKLNAILKQMRREAENS